MLINLIDLQIEAFSIGICVDCNHQIQFIYLMRFDLITSFDLI